MFPVWRFFCLLSPFLRTVLAECPNACSGNGVCGAFDMCKCFKNWMANDCSQRVCQFGFAYVDSPKGNLNMSPPPLESADELIAVKSQLYPFGTTEQYPNAVKGDGVILTNTAHYYMECSNRGICDRTQGVCECLEGFEGSACQRVSCPTFDGAVCSGHGICEDAESIAKLDHNNVYKLWDDKISQGCICDPGYSGPMCSLRVCPVGFDPIYATQSTGASKRYSTWSYTLHVTSSSADILGVYSIKFIDIYGEDWITDPISANASCNDVLAALERLPNDVIRPGSVRCFKVNHGPFINYDPISLKNSPSFFGMKYTLAFTMNPGVLEPISIDMHLDGDRPTLFASTGDTKAESFVYPDDGVFGEDTDYFRHRCEGVLFKLKALSLRSDDDQDWINNGKWTVMHDLTVLEVQRLKRCLHTSGGGDGNLELTEVLDDSEFQWEAGSLERPHFVRIVPVSGVPETSKLFQTHAIRRPEYKASVDQKVPGDFPLYSYDFPGFLAALVYDTDSKLFKLFNKYNSASMGGGNPDVEFAVHVTDGELYLASDKTRITTSAYSRPFQQTENANINFESNDFGDKFNPQGLFNPVVYGIVASPSLYHLPDTSTFYELQYVDCESYEAAPDASSPYTRSQEHALRLNVNCIDKGDLVTFFDPRTNRDNPSQLGLYHVTKISRVRRDSYRNIIEIRLNQGFPSFWHESSSNDGRAYIFRPPEGGDGVYKYVSECSGRGQCDTETGVCNCFTGYTGVSCSDQMTAAA